MQYSKILENVSWHSNAGSVEECFMNTVSKSKCYTLRCVRVTGMEDQAQHREYVYRMTELQRQTELVQQQLRLERLMQELKPTYTEVRDDVPARLTGNII